MIFDLDEEIVIITGVSGQLGNAYARAFLEAGAKVVGLDLHECAHTHELNTEYPERYFFEIADLTIKSSLQHAFESITLKVGTPTVLINNAALDSPPSSPLEENGPFENYPEESWDKVMNVNLKGVYLCCQVFGGAMAKANKGSIINISSIYGLVAPDQNLYQYRRNQGEVFYKPVAYSASKSGVLNLTRYLAIYWAKQNVRVNSLTIAGVFNNQDKEFLDVYCARIPVGRMADTKEYNGAVMFLASKASAYMTGSNMIIDGGWTAI